MINLTFETSSAEYSFKRKFQAKLSPYKQIFEQPEEELIDLKVKQQMKPNMFSSEHNQNVALTINSEHLSSEGPF